MDPLLLKTISNQLNPDKNMCWTTKGPSINDVGPFFQFFDPLHPLITPVKPWNNTKLPFFVPPSLSLWNDVIYEWSLSGNTGFYLRIMAIRSSGVCWQNNIIWAKNDHATAGVEWLGRGLLKINPKIIKKPAFAFGIHHNHVQIISCCQVCPPFSRQLNWRFLTLCVQLCRK